VNVPPMSTAAISPWPSPSAMWVSSLEAFPA
jgi:hypothetical protein